MRPGPEFGHAAQPSQFCAVTAGVLAGVREARCAMGENSFRRCREELVQLLVDRDRAPSLLHARRRPLLLPARRPRLRLRHDDAMCLAHLHYATGGHGVLPE